MITILEWLREVTIFSSIMILIIVSFKAIFKEKVDIKIIHMLWILLLARLIIPITFASPVHLDSFVKLPDKVSIVAESTESKTVLQPQISNKAQSQVVMPNVDMQNNEQATIAMQAEKPESKESVIDRITAIKITTYLFFVWIIGALFIFIKKNIAAIKFKRLIMLEDKNKHIELFDTRAKVVISSFVSTPVTFGLIKPVILIPKKLIGKVDKKQLQLIMLHEITHIKRKDILFNYLWLIAKSIYWYNPLVWFAYTQYSEDIEIACDEMVVRRISEDDRYQYSLSLLEVIKLSKPSIAPQIGMGFCEDKSKLRKRVEKMLKPTKKLKIASVLAAMLALIMIIGCFTTACMKAESEEIQVDTEVVEVSATQDETEEKIVVEQVEEVKEIPVYGYEAPETYEDEYVLNAYEKFVIDSEVNFQDVEVYPVARLKSVDFSNETATKVKEYFVGDSDIIPAFVEVKADFQEDIDDIKDMLENDTDGDADFIEWCEKTIEQLENKKEAAPEVASTDPIKNIEVSDIELNTQVVENGKTESYFRVSSKRLGYQKNIYEERGAASPDFFAMNNIKVDLESVPVEISEEQASKIAMDTLAEFGIEDLTICNIEQWYYIDEANYPNVNGVEQQVTLLRKIGDVNPMLMRAQGGKIDDPYTYKPPQEQEYVRICIDDKGEVVRFEWCNPVEFIGMESESVELMPFEEVMEKSKEFMRLFKGYNGETETDNNGGYLMKNIYFTMYYIQEDAESDEFLYAPCWVFEYQYSENTDRGLQDDTSFDYVLFNAINGESVSNTPLSFFEY